MAILSDYYAHIHTCDVNVHSFCNPKIFIIYQFYLYIDTVYVFTLRVCSGTQKFKRKMVAGVQSWFKYYI